MDVADSSSSKSSIGGIDGPCSPCTLTRTKRTHKQKNRCNKFNATTTIDGFSKLSATLPLSPICCFVAIINLRTVCVVSFKNVFKKLSLNCRRTAVIDLCNTFRNVPSAFFARCVDFRNGQKRSGFAGRCPFTCTKFAFDLQSIRRNTATFTLSVHFIVPNAQWKTKILNSIYNISIAMMDLNSTKVFVVYKVYLKIENKNEAISEFIRSVCV